MSEDSDLEKTEPASARRLEQAREEGDVPQSRELVSFVLLATGALGLWVMSESIVRAASSFLARCLEFHRYDYTRAQAFKHPSGAGKIFQFYKKGQNWMFLEPTPK